MSTDLWGYGWRTSAVVPGSTIFRGIDLSDLPDELKDRAHRAIDGGADARLHDDLLNHVGGEHGFSGWWTDDPENAKHYAAGGHHDDNALRAVLATDWNGEGQDHDYTDEEVGDDDVPLRDEPPRPHTVWVSRPGSGWVNVSHARTAARLAMPMPLPDDIVFKYHPDRQYPKVTAHVGDDPEHIGYLEWNGRDLPPRGEIADINVKSEHQGKSIATSMFDFAKSHEPHLHHSDDLTEDGEGWSNYEQSRNKEARIMSAAVTVYTQPNCIQCTMTKKQLDKLGIEHDTVDVTADPEAHSFVTGLGYKQAPVVVVNGGETHWAGFKPDLLKGLVE